MTSKLITEKEHLLVSLVDSIPKYPSMCRFDHYEYCDDKYEQLKYLDLMEKTLKEFKQFILKGSVYKLEYNDNDNDDDNIIWKYVFDDFEKICQFNGYDVTTRDTGSNSGLFDPSGEIVMTIHIPKK